MTEQRQQKHTEIEQTSAKAVPVGIVIRMTFKMQRWFPCTKEH